MNAGTILHCLSNHREWHTFKAHVCITWGFFSIQICHGQITLNLFVPKLVNLAHAFVAVRIEIEDSVVYILMTLLYLKCSSAKLR